MRLLTAILNILYIRRLKSIQIKIKEFRPELKTIRKVSMLGISSFITEMSFVFVVAVENNLLSKYGAQSKLGSEIPITVLGI